MSGRSIIQPTTKETIFVVGQPRYGLSAVAYRNEDMAKIHAAMMICGVVTPLHLRDSFSPMTDQELFLAVGPKLAHGVRRLQPRAIKLALETLTKDS